MKPNFFALVFFVGFIFLFPKYVWSRFVGWLADRKLHSSMRLIFLGMFAKIFGINMKEAEKPLEQYQSFNEVFVRRLKKDSRAISFADVVSPVDGRILVWGNSHKQKMLQVKGKEMSLRTLLIGDQQISPHFEKDFLQPFYDGLFITLYLSPADYHRIHSPASGNIIGYSYVPGSFFPVNSLAVHGIKNLFNRNERWTTFLQTTKGKIAIVKVAATSVGRIPVVYESSQNKIFAHRKKTLHSYSSPVSIEKGQELARFELGSTVILLLEKDCFQFSSLKEDGKINYGEAIALLK